MFASTITSASCLRTTTWWVWCGRVLLTHLPRHRPCLQQQSRVSRTTRKIQSGLLGGRKNHDLCGTSRGLPPGYDRHPRNRAEDKLWLWRHCCRFQRAVWLYRLASILMGQSMCWWVLELPMEEELLDGFLNIQSSVFSGSSKRLPPDTWESTAWWQRPNNQTHERRWGTGRFRVHASVHGATTHQDLATVSRSSKVDPTSHQPMDPTSTRSIHGSSTWSMGPWSVAYDLRQGIRWVPTWNSGLANLVWR